jgi:hypothetical protein
MKRWFFRWVLVLSLSAFALNSTSAQRQKPLVSTAGSDVLLYAEPSGATPTIHIQTNASATPFDARLLGSNLPAWLNPTSFADGTFRARTAASGVGVLRMPGGSWSNTYDWLACENGAAPCDWASRPTDFINFLRATGAQGMWTVSINGTSKEAAALVAFFNAAITDTTPIGLDVRGRDWKTAGDWAQLRSNHGNAAPYPIKLWDVGNEVYGGLLGNSPNCTVPWGWEDVWTCDGAEYVNGIGVGANRHEGYLEFRAAMRAVDSTILVGAVGVPTANSWSNWGNEVLAAAGNVMDFYVIHQYAYDTPPSTYTEALAQPEMVWNSIRADLDDAFTANAGGRNIPVAVNEYNLITVQDNDTGRMMTRAFNLLFMADTLGQIAQNGFVMANQWDLANGAAANGTDYGLMKDSTYGYARSPQYYAYPLWARFGAQRLPVTTTVSAAATLSVYAGRVDTDTLSLLAINKTDQTLTATIETDGGLTFTGGLADVARAASLVTTTVTFNGVSSPANDLSDAPSQPVGGPASPLVYFFPPYSVTLLRLDTSAVPPSRVYLPLVLK